MKFKRGDKVKIKKNTTLEEIAKNHFNGCQRDTFIFLRDYFYSLKFDNTFTIKDIEFNNAVKVGNSSCWINSVIFEKVEEILDDKEKEYLRGVIKPFKNRISDIVKISPNNTESFIIIHMDNRELIGFPYFKKNTMYKGMEIDKKYTLKELGLDE